MCLAERANLIQSGQPIDGGEREIAPERVAMPCDARSSPFVVIGSPGARMKAHLTSTRDLVDERVYIHWHKITHDSPWYTNSYAVEPALSVPRIRGAWRRRRRRRRRADRRIYKILSFFYKLQSLK